MRRILAHCLLVLCIGAPVHADEKPTASGEDRPRVGLVLSGGGARGAAHIGVLKVLEEARIPIDYIVGTSMGSIIGGLYAAGLSPEEMEQAVGGTDWEAIFDDRPDRKLIPFRRKKDDFSDLMNFEFSVSRRGLSAGSGMIGGRKLEFMLRSLLFKRSRVRDFDEMTIPFRAIATDLESGEMVVLGDGDLADALRASMSVPGVFLPVEIDGRLLVDGGLVRNIPVDVARSMGADLLIVVDISSHLGGMPEEQSAFSVLMRSFSLTMAQNKNDSISQLSDDDLLLVPDLEGFSAADFIHLREIIDLGEKAARARLAELERYAMTAATYERFVSRRRVVADSDREDPIIDRIRVDGLRRVDPRLVIGHMKTREGGVIDLARLQRDMGRVYEIGEFRSVDFDLRDVAGETHLVISVKEEEKAGFLRFGLTLDSDFRGSGDFVIRTDYRWTQVNRFGAEWQTTIFGGKENGFTSEFYQPLDWSGGWFVAPRASYTRTSITGRAEIDLKFVNAGFDVGYQFGNWAEFRFGVLTGKLEGDIRSLAGDAGFDVDLGAYRTTLQVDQLDSAFVPREGSYLGIQFEDYRRSLGSADEYRKLSVLVARAWSFGDFTVLGKADYGDSLGTTLPFYNAFALGGFLELSGLGPGELSGRTLAFGTLLLYQRIATFPGRLGNGVFAGASLEFGNAWTDAQAATISDLKTGASVFLAVDSIVGPAWLAVGHSEGDTALYFLLGHPF